MRTLCIEIKDRQEEARNRRQVVKQKVKSTTERENDIDTRCIPQLSLLCSELVSNITFLRHTSENEENNYFNDKQWKKLDVVRHLAICVL